MNFIRVNCLEPKRGNVLIPVLGVQAVTNAVVLCASPAVSGVVHLRGAAVRLGQLALAALQTGHAKLLCGVRMP